MFAYQVNEQIELHFLTHDFAEPLFELIQQNFDMLAEWFPWPAFTKEVADSEQFIQRQLEAYARQKVWPLAIVVNGELAGMTDLHNINRDHRSAEVGYWLASRFQGQGVVTKALAAMLPLAFDLYDLHVIRIDAEEDNLASRNVAERLGFQLDGVIRGKIVRDQQPRDLAVYSLLRSEIS
ncbi:GNAT family N-acetyltransferase [Salinibius halmophilus]|uniref:GNAT family N-acetyltransferase n=1 Tax=Salinibius halmophilus TaxID=1853216 RepID=UPI000E6646D4|nr:GNAT family protein [Salinibius halmophilus]